MLWSSLNEDYCRKFDLNFWSSNLCFIVEFYDNYFFALLLPLPTLCVFRNLMGCIIVSSLLFSLPNYSFLEVDSNLNLALTKLMWNISCLIKCNISLHDALLFLVNLSVRKIWNLMDWQRELTQCKMMQVNLIRFVLGMLVGGEGFAISNRLQALLTILSLLAIPLAFYLSVDELASKRLVLDRRNNGIPLSLVHIAIRLFISLVSLFRCS